MGTARDTEQLENLEMTPELVAKAERAAADCDSEIIHFQPPH